MTSSSNLDYRSSDSFYFAINLFQYRYTWRCRWFIHSNRQLWRMTCNCRKCVLTIHMMNKKWHVIVNYVDMMKSTMSPCVFVLPHWMTISDKWGTSLPTKQEHSPPTSCSLENALWMEFHTALAKAILADWLRMKQKVGKENTFNITIVTIILTAMTRLWTRIGSSCREIYSTCWHLPI